MILLKRERERWAAEVEVVVAEEVVAEEVVAAEEVVSEVVVVADEVCRLEGEEEKRLEDDGICLRSEEVSQTFFNERSARKQTSCNIQTSARVCAAQT
ncbi:hypothetical protein Hanom_Chr02g00121811 [Helianthus anomalus]